jgi:transcriptional regulator with XRE-family HTH domain
MATVDRWSGRESRMLRQALRQTVRDFAEDLGVSPRTISKWEAGGADHIPRPELQAALDTALSRATEEQQDRFDGAVSVPGEQPASPPWEGRDRSRCVLGLVDVAEVRDEVRSLTSAYDVTPSVSLLAPAAHCQARITDLRTRARRGPVRRELYAAETEASTLMGQLVWDASQRRDHTTAGQYFEHAAGVARQIHDPVAEAHAVLRQSFVALYGWLNPAAGLALADRAADLSRAHSLVLTGSAMLHVAEAHGMLGDRAACERALADAQTCFDERSDLDVVADYYSPTQLGR